MLPRGRLAPVVATAALILGACAQSSEGSPGINTQEPTVAESSFVGSIAMDVVEDRCYLDVRGEGAVKINGELVEIINEPLPLSLRGIVDTNSISTVPEVILSRGETVTVSFVDSGFDWVQTC